jgi:hypothetical protein
LIFETFFLMPECSFETNFVSIYCLMIGDSYLY